MDPLEKALRILIADLDYDHHKAIECGEDDGVNRYPELTDWFRDVLEECYRENAGSDSLPSAVLSRLP